MRLISKLVFSLLVLFTTISSAEEGTSCDEILYSKSEDGFFMGEIENSTDFRFIAYVADRVLNISLYAKSHNGESHPRFQGRKQMNLILDNFDGEFDSVMGNWIAPGSTAPSGKKLSEYDGTKISRSDNLSAFNKAIREGYSFEEAALLTWTGKQMLAHGYNQVKIETLVGGRGNYHRAVVLFRKPEQ